MMFLFPVSGGVAVKLDGLKIYHQLSTKQLVRQGISGLQKELSPMPQGANLEQYCFSGGLNGGKEL